jgi:[FeFe] hydrogenase H-cluster maturation GTPase HydF
MMERTDVAVLVAEANVWSDYEKTIMEEFTKREIPFMVVFNKIDLFPTDTQAKENLLHKGVSFVEISAISSGWEVTALIKRKLIGILPEDWILPHPLISDLIVPSEPVVFVSAKDMEMPKGRIKLPMQQALREVLDNQAWCLTVDESRLVPALDGLTTAPQLMVTESHILNKVLQSVPASVPVTTFSILYARWKGDITEFTENVKKIDSLEPRDRVLMLEACTHHPIGEDIGRMKIPNWINRRRGGGIEFDICSGHDIPADLEKYKLVVHCGACMFNRKEMLTRILRCKERKVAITNYGIAIAYLHDALKRTLQPFTRRQPVNADEKAALLGV